MLKTFLTEFIEGARALDVDSEPRATQLVSHTARPADQRLRKRARTNCDQKPVAGFPGAACQLSLAKFRRVVAHVVGNKTQRQLSQCGEIPFAKKALRGRCRTIWNVDFAFVQTPNKLSRRQIDQFQN